MNQRRIVCLFRVLTSPDDLDAVMDWADPLRPKKRNLIEIAKVWKSGRPFLSRIATAHHRGAKASHFTSDSFSLPA